MKTIYITPTEPVRVPAEIVTKINKLLNEGRYIEAKELIILFKVSNKDLKV